MANGDLSQRPHPGETPLSGAVGTVVRYIREGVREGWLVPGQRLVEPDLIARLEVSRGTVREALTRLQGEGLVDFERFRGARIRILSRKAVVELNQIRAALEGLGARLAAVTLDERGAKELRDAHPPFEKALHDYSAYNKNLHNAILRLSGNESLAPAIFATFRETFRLQFDKTLSTQESRLRSYGEHSAIVEAILKRDPKKAERRMIEHINSSTHAIMQAPDHFFSR
jgi:DNA-binding GntR family transcriptional regulator